MAGGRIQKTVALLGISAVSILVSLILIEIGARGWLGLLADEGYFRRYATISEMKARHPNTLGVPFRYVPHRYIGYIPSPGFRGAWAYHNSSGFRSAEMPRVKPEGEFRIVALGASTTYSIYPKPEDMGLVGKLSPGITSEEDPDIAALLRSWRLPDIESLLHSNSYPGYLGFELRGRGYTNVRVINGGAEGYTSWESLISFQLRCLDLDPDMVLVYHGFNDIHDRLIWPYEAYRGDNSGMVTHSSGWYQPLPLPLRSTALRILLVALGRARSPADLVLTFGTLEPAAMFWLYEKQHKDRSYPSGFFLEHSVQEILQHNKPVYFKRNIENIVLTAKHRGIQPVLLTFASSDADEAQLFNTDEYNLALGEHNQVIRDIGRDLEVPVVDLAEIFSDRPELFTDTVHMTSEGGWVMARLLADALISQELLPR